MLSVNSHQPDSSGATPRGGRVGLVVRTLGAAALAYAVTAVAPALAGAATISPLPGTPDASPSTQISILGVDSSKIQSVTVTGSISGAHSGSLVAYGSAKGASYVLAAPFTSGEEVTAVVKIGKHESITDTFTVAHPGPTPPFLNLSAEQPEKLEHFQSVPGLHPPKISVSTADSSDTSSIFLTPLPAPTIHPSGEHLLELHPVGPGGPMILNSQGQLVWFDQLPPSEEAANLQLTSYEGHPALAWWQGKVTAWAYGVGEGVIADTSYHTLATIKAGNGYPLDIHELQITPEGSAYVSVYAPECLPVCSAEHPPVLDSIVQEIDIHTGLVMWEWHALGHVPITDSLVGVAAGELDPYHINSIQPLPGNRILVSLRDTSAIYEIDLTTGAIVWTLGGKESSFQMEPGATFYFQHDAQLKGDKVSMFDDESGPPVYAPTSRGLVLKLNEGNKTATVLHEYVRPQPTLADSEGSLQSLAGGNVFVGFGSTESFSEFSKTGVLKFDAALPKDDGSYRAYRFPWSATPSTLPAIAATRESPEQVSVYASWNGATNVANWEVLAGESTESLAPVVTAARSGFETEISVPSSASTFEVRALDGEGHVLAASEPVSAP